MHQDHSQRQTQVQKIGPYLIHANTLLQCSNTELLQIIEQEQQLNPALDSGDNHVEGSGNCLDCPGAAMAQCPRCPFNREGHPLAFGFNGGVGLRGPADEDGYLAGHGEYPDQETRGTRSEGAWSLSDPYGRAISGSGDVDFDPASRARAPSTLADYLLSQLRSVAGIAIDIRVAEYLVGSLDERGYLQINPDEACAVLQAPIQAIEVGIARLQACDPPGIGARNLCECLLLQMENLKDTGEEHQYNSLAHRILSEHWETLVQRRQDLLPRRLRAKPDQVKEAIHFIQNQLTPHPAAQFRHHWDHKPDNHIFAIRPDVVISRGPTGFKVEIPGFDQTAIQINPHYQGLYDSIRATNGTAAKRMVNGLKGEQEVHIVAYVERANLFLKNLHRRRRTIQKIADALIEYQQGYLDTGNRAFLRPLTRTQLAQGIGLHESTISRALMHKFVQLPSQEVVPFDVFFESSVSAKEAVAALIALENPAAPLSDMAITKSLHSRGMVVARRTVLKYREELRIPASYLRRQRKAG